MARRLDSIFQDDGSIDLSVRDTPAYQRRVAREDARWRAKASAAEIADMDRYVAMIDHARAQGDYPKYGAAEARLLAWWQHTAERTLSVDAAYALYVRMQLVHAAH